ncbi:MFS-type transporter SLC18B1-like isoform X2 [Eriocheir sinensis]|nr:MFS-type transporter SLC18B1-like isoform X2 [Eriocheir sinensis]XP_050688463.1 MFS-type transporter SLC18B1-like isoform X2 [Eriocheir sinensis]
MEGRQCSGLATQQQQGADDHLQESQPNPPALDASPLSPSSTSSSSSSSSSSSDSSSSPSSPLPTLPHVIVDETREDTTDRGSPVYKPTTEAKKEGRWGCCKSLRRVKQYKALGVGEGSPCARRKRRPGNGGEVSSEPKKCLFTQYQWMLLVLICFSSLTTSLAICLFPPFFPKLAQKKGCSSTLFGLIIGTNCLTSFLVTPFIGKKLNKIGIKFAFSAGIFASGACCILSGLLEWFPPGAVFVTTAIMIRAAHATANALTITSIFAFIGMEFPESMAQVFAWTRTAMNVAQMLGPVVGGALIEVGGFKLPFLVMGSIQMSMTFLCCMLPPDEPEDKTKPEGSSEVSIWRVITIPSIWIAFITFIFSTMSNGFLSINLEPQVLRPFGMRSLYVGLLFGLKDGANSLAAPFWGWVCDRYRRFSKVYIFFSSILAFASFFFLGPFPGLPLERTIGIVIMSLTLNGVGIGGQQVAGVVDAMREAVHAGLPDEASLHGCVAGLWASFSGIGRFSSRTVSGYLVDTIGFRNTSAIVVALHAFVVAMTGTYLAVFWRREFARKQGGGEENERDRFRGVLNTSPADPVTTKTINIATSLRDNIEDSIVLGSAPIPVSTSYARGYLSCSPFNRESV